MQSRNKREGRYAGYYHRHVRTRGRLGVSNIGVSSPAARYAARKPVHPKPMMLDSNTVMEAVKRVMETHADVIKALGNR